LESGDTEISTEHQAGCCQAELSYFPVIFRGKQEAGSLCRAFANGMTAGQE